MRDKLVLPPEKPHRILDDIRARIHGCLRDTHGFTLVELVVVLIIIAILAAAIGPALIGYIDKARQNETLANAKKVYMSAQTLADEAHSALVKPESKVTAERISELTKIPFDAGTVPYSITYKNNIWNSNNPTNAMYMISEFTYDEGGYRASYSKDSGTWIVTDISR